MSQQLDQWYADKIGALCPKCKKRRTADGHDPCIPNLPGVRFACCGHGIREGYIYFENGIRIGVNVVEVEQYDPTKKQALGSSGHQPADVVSAAKEVET